MGGGRYHSHTYVMWDYIHTSDAHPPSLMLARTTLLATFLHLTHGSQRRKDAEERQGSYPSAFVGQQFFLAFHGRVSINSSTTDPVAVGRFCTIRTFLQFLFIE